MSIAEQVDELERAGDGYRHAIAELTRMNEMLVRDRDQWKARAEKAEVKVSELECELYAARSIPRQTVADLQLKAELQQALEAAEKRVKELETKLALAEKERDEAKETVGSIQEDYSELESERNRLNRRVQELERQLSSRPSTLEAVLEECLAENICVGVSIVDTGAKRHRVRISVERKGKGRVIYVESLSEAAEKLCETVGDRDFYPDSAFARRRKPAEPTPNSSETPNSSPDDTSDRYRRIVELVAGYLDHKYGSIECVSRIRDAINGKEAAK